MNNSPPPYEVAVESPVIVNCTEPLEHELENQNLPACTTLPPCPEKTYLFSAGDRPPLDNVQTIFVINDGEDGPCENLVSFSNKSLRRAFIKKVYLILTAQLLMTCIFISIFQFSTQIKVWVQLNIWFYIMSYIVFIAIYIVLIYCPKIRRKYPGNFIALSIFTFATSYMTAAIASFHDTPAVLAAIVTTAILCFIITIFAIQTKFDFTMCIGFIIVLSVVFLMTPLMCIIIYLIYPSDGMALHGLWAGLGILLFGMYLIYDTQTIVGGKNLELSPEDYIEGALQLYLDCVNLFLLILSLFGSGE